MIDGLGRYIKVLLANLKSAPLNEWIWTKAVLLKSVVSLGVMVVELLRLSSVLYLSRSFAIPRLKLRLDS